MSRQASLEKARKSYTEKQANIKSLITKLQDELRKHGKNDEIHWGHVGDLGHVQSELREIVGFLAGDDEA